MTRDPVLHACTLRDVFGLHGVNFRGTEWNAAQRRVTLMTDFADGVANEKMILVSVGLLERALSPDSDEVLQGSADAKCANRVS